jgi:hypothetical protein
MPAFVPNQPASTRAQPQALLKEYNCHAQNTKPAPTTSSPSRSTPAAPSNTPQQPSMTETALRAALALTSHFSWKVLLGGTRMNPCERQSLETGTPTLREISPQNISRSGNSQYVYGMLLPPTNFAPFLCTSNTHSPNWAPYPHHVECKVDMNNSGTRRRTYSPKHNPLHQHTHERAVGVNLIRCSQAIWCCVRVCTFKEATTAASRLPIHSVNNKNNQETPLKDPLTAGHSAAHFERPY